MYANAFQGNPVVSSCFCPYTAYGVHITALILDMYNILFEV